MRGRKHKQNVAMIRIGSYTLSTPVFLAPMAGVTDSLFRSICLARGAGYAASEMISSDTILHNSDKTLRRIMRAEGALPHAVQIVGSEPAKLAEAAQYNVAQGAQIIDINMGCPAKKVCNKLAGSALLSDEKLVDKILSAVVKSVDVPVTLKIRTGPDRDSRNGVRIARIAEQNGIQALAVHGRTRADRFNGEAEFDTIAAIKDTITIPVIANGDINSVQDARRVLSYTNADGIMIGRAAQGYPWIFREISSWLDKGELAGLPDDNEVHRTLTEHVKGLHNLYGDYRGLRIARKHIAWYIKKWSPTGVITEVAQQECTQEAGKQDRNGNKRGAAGFRNTINSTDSAREQLALIDRFFECPELFEPLQAGSQRGGDRCSKKSGRRVAA